MRQGGCDRSLHKCCALHSLRSDGCEIQVQLSAMDPQNYTHEGEQRLTNLEIKATFTEDLLEQLEKVIVRQQQQIDALIRDFAEARQPDTYREAGTMRNLRDDLPPHF